MNHNVLKPGPSAVSSSAVGISIHSATSTISLVGPPANTTTSSSALIEEHEIQRLNPANTYFWTECYGFFDSETFREIFNASAINAASTAGQICSIYDILCNMLKKLRFITVEELRTIIEFAGVCVLWIALSGFATQAKKNNSFNPKKLFGHMKDYETHVPAWLLDALSTTDFAHEKSFQVLLR